MEKRRIERSLANAKLFKATTQQFSSLSVINGDVKQLKQVPFEKIVIASHPRPNTSDRWINFVNDCMLHSKLQLKCIVSHPNNDGRRICSLQIRDAGITSNLAEGEGCDISEAKLAAFKNAFEILLKNCYTLKFQTSNVSTDSEVDLDQILSWSNNQSKEFFENSIGARMMKTMGWTGGGLGKDGTGITEPTKGITKTDRRGLGHQPWQGRNSDLKVDDGQFEDAVNNLLQDFVRRKPLTKLVFSSKLSLDHRKIIAQCINLDWKGQLKREKLDKDSDRIAVSPVFSLIELVERVMAEGGKTDQYIVYPPDTLTLEDFERLFLKNLDLRLSPSDSVNGEVNHVPVPFEKIVISSSPRPLTNDGWIDILNESLSFANLKLQVELVQTDKVVCSLQIRGEDGISDLAKGEGSNRNEAIFAASKNAFEMLLKKCYSLKKSEASIPEEIDVNEILSWSEKKDKKETNKLSENNIGAKMLKSMGWTGGGLGKDGSGITEPITESTLIKRSGIGHKPNPNDYHLVKDAISNLLKDYIRRKPLKNLLFTGTWALHRRIIARISRPRTKENGRHLIPNCANNWKNQLKSRNIPFCNHVVVSSVFTPIELVEKVIAEGGKSDQYIAYPPGTLNWESFEELFQKKLDLGPQPRFPSRNQKNVVPVPFKKIFVLSRFQKKFADGWVDVLKKTIRFSKLHLRGQIVKAGKESACLYQVHDGSKTSNLAEGKGHNKVEAKLSASINALKILLKNCYTVKVAKVSFDNLVDTEDVLRWSDENSGLMYGGFRENGTGVLNPMNVKINEEKTDDDLQFEDALYNMLDEFSKRKPLTCLVFSPHLSRLYKKMIKNCLREYFKSKLTFETVISGETHIIISSKFEPTELVKRIIAEGGEIDRYTVYPPDTLTFENLQSQLEEKIDLRDCTTVSLYDLGLGTGAKFEWKVTFRDIAKNLIDDYADSPAQKPLAFPSVLTQNQRAFIHRYVAQNRKTLGIYSESYGIASRFIVVYKNASKEFESEEENLNGSIESLDENQMETDN